MHLRFSNYGGGGGNYGKMEKMNLWVDHPLGEWLLDVETSYNIVDDVMHKLAFDKQSKILIPGVG